MERKKTDMPINKNIRPVTPNDIPVLKKVIDANGLFPSDMLDDMISDYFDNDNSSDFWLTYADHEPITIAYCAPEKMTEGTWNLYLIAVHPECQGEGLGTSMVRYIEQMLKKRGERLLLVETSGLAEFDRTRAFYRQCGFDEEARIREFYQAGEDKIVFRKSLTDTKQ
jgi:ribosomal protein S18 acetylase RimI-like enzyme